MNNRMDYKLAREFWHGMPARVRMVKTVRSDIPFILPRLVALCGCEYEVTCNPFGALSVILNDGEKLGVKPDEIEVIEWW